MERCPSKFRKIHSNAPALDSFFLKNKLQTVGISFLIALQASGSESLYQTACIKISFFYILILFVCLLISWMLQHFLLLFGFCFIVFC